MVQKAHQCLACRLLRPMPGNHQALFRTRQGHVQQAHSFRLGHLLLPLPKVKDVGGGQLSHLEHQVGAALAASQPPGPGHRTAVAAAPPGHIGQKHERKIEALGLMDGGDQYRFFRFRRPASPFPLRFLHRPTQGLHQLLWGWEGRQPAQNEAEEALEVGNPHPPGKTSGFRSLGQKPGLHPGHKNIGRVLMEALAQHPKAKQSPKRRLLPTADAVFSRHERRKPLRHFRKHALKLGKPFPIHPVKLPHQREKAPFFQLPPRRVGNPRPS
ncbi:hypothetical protein HRbin09_01273 [bacterium HR09]|nr:hypothetical protein HRbin09_01273 [bacterium HR09]